ncbi:hypothetical protein [Cupriavidus taiwanensis]
MITLMTPLPLPGPRWIPETRALYCEVCGLLFFRYGITPTANKLLSAGAQRQHGSVPEVLQGFWHELRRANPRHHRLVVIAQKRAEASERRALRELDPRHIARRKSEHAAEDLRTALSAAHNEARDAAVGQAEARARLQT